MNKKSLIIFLSFLLCISMISCARNRIIVSNEYTFEESFEKLENEIADKYELENFELVRIMMTIPKGGTRKQLDIQG